MNIIEINGKHYIYLQTPPNIVFKGLLIWPGTVNMYKNIQSGTSEFMVEAHVSLELFGPHLQFKEGLVNLFG